MAVGHKTGGRRAGTPNKATRAAKEAIALFVDGNAWRLQGWLEEIEKMDGALAAANFFVRVLEFHVPKLARIEATGEGGGPMIVQMLKYDENI